MFEKGETRQDEISRKIRFSHPRKIYIIIYIYTGMYIILRNYAYV